MEGNDVNIVNVSESDSFYMKNLSFKLDLKWLTFRVGAFPFVFPPF